ncbi:MAG: hypothetical protein EOP05_00040 [Proteobacteria bacterium]|nr:MAG: hypothetical protein EOP05_00040 [Pseudomonadota bacterium]
MIWDRGFAEALLKAKTDREFLKIFFETSKGWKAPKRLTYQQFSSRAGFSSKGFISEILAGKKRITPTAFEKFALGLKLNDLWKRYLKALVSISNESFHTIEMDREFFQSELQEAKSHIISNLFSRQSLDWQMTFTIAQVDVESIKSSLNSLLSAGPTPTTAEASAEIVILIKCSG